MNRRCLLALAVCHLFLISGCSKPTPEFGQVTGKVLVNGKPVSKLLVRFLPMPSEGNDWPINAQGVTDDEGNYVLEYYFDEKQGKGAPIGWHRVLIEDTTLASIPQGEAPPPERIPKMYANPSNSKLKEEVSIGEQTKDFDLSL